jgi:hypothetical protein
MKDIDLLTMDELHVILTTYEMRTKKGKASTKGNNFKSIKEDKRTQIL